MHRMSAATTNNPEVPQSIPLRSHLITWSLIFFILTLALLLHLLAASSTPAGAFLRALLESGDPKGPSTNGFGHDFLFWILLIATAWTLAHRYARTFPAAAVVAIGNAVFWSLVILPMTTLIRAHHPDFPTQPSFLNGLPFCLIFSAAACIFGHVGAAHAARHQSS